MNIREQAELEMDRMETQAIEAANRFDALSQGYLARAEKAEAQVELLKAENARLRDVAWDAFVQDCARDAERYDDMGMSTYERMAACFERAGWIETDEGRIWRLTEKGKAALRGEVSDETS